MERNGREEYLEMLKGNVEKLRVEREARVKVLNDVHDGVVRGDTETSEQELVVARRRVADVEGEIERAVRRVLSF